MLLDAFDRVFVINLVSRPDRRRETVEELTRTFGSDAVEEKVEFVAASRPDRPGTFESIGARGVFESHRSVIRLARDRGLETILLLEDDIAFTGTERQLDVAGDLLRSTPWGYGSLGYFEDEWLAFTAPPSAREAMRREVGPEATIPDDGGQTVASADGVELVTVRGGHTGTHCMAVRREACDLILAHLDRCYTAPPGSDVIAPMHVDGAYNTFGWLHPATVRITARPNLAGQRSSASDVTPHWVDRIPAAAPISRALRTVRRKLF